MPNPLQFFEYLAATAGGITLTGLGFVLCRFLYFLLIGDGPIFRPKAAKPVKPNVE